jgi:hypothetical protein
MLYVVLTDLHVLVLAYVAYEVRCCANTICNYTAFSCAIFACGNSLCFLYFIVNISKLYYFRKFHFICFIHFSQN